MVFTNQSLYQKLDQDRNRQVDEYELMALNLYDNMSPETFKKEFLKDNIGYICYLSWANIIHREKEARNTTSNIAIYGKTGGYWPKIIDISRKTEE